MTNIERSLLLLLARGVAELLDDEAKAFRETNELVTQLRGLIERVQAEAGCSKY